MADAVQQLMEDMVPEIEDLQKREIFSQPEVRSIVKRRRQYEYTIKRRRPELKDFIRYAKYEMQLDRLRRKRKKRLGVKKAPLSDYAGMKRIHFIFERALRKFQGDDSLWLQYIEFCMSTGSDRALNKTFARGLQLHPRNASLWILAASWEYEKNANMVTARVLLQRALRMNPTSPKLFLEYFRLEVLYINKLRTRMALSGVDGQTLMNRAKGIDVEDVPGDEGDESPAATEAAAAEGEAGGGLEDNPFFEGAIPLAIYQSAVNGPLRDNWSARIQFLDVLDDSPGADLLTSLRKSILRDSVETFSSCEDFWDALAGRRVVALRTQDRMPTEDEVVAAVAQAVGLYEQAVRVLPSSGMWKYYVTFVRSSAQAGTPSSSLRSALAILRRAVSEAPTHDEWILCEYIDELRGAGRATAAQKLERESVRHLPHSAPLRYKLLSGWTKEKDFEAAFLDSLAGVSEHDAGLVWRAWFEKSVGWNVSVKEFMAHVKSLLSLPPPAVQQVLPIVLSCAVAASALTVDNVREAYTTCIRHPSCDVPFKRLCVEFELRQTKRDDTRIQKLYDGILSGDAGKTNDDLWIEFITFQLKCGRLDEVACLYRRAVNTLANAAIFTRRYEMEIKSVAVEV
eukprot:TRINITY_DN2325_c0_g1_i1.p1 TRINITY_DN2325_c0_g1~~TRINITY_DN2325_c0_g1_i1.p1  ORF type:complete len:626 (+),score=166.27 TRINITY_DN2325_c0_g1_i1:322-2199(+)